MVRWKGRRGESKARGVGRLGQVFVGESEGLGAAGTGVERVQAKRINVHSCGAEILLCKAKGLLVFAHLLLTWTHFPPAGLKYLSSVFSLSPPLTMAAPSPARPFLPSFYRLQ